MRDAVSMVNKHGRAVVDFSEPGPSLEEFCNHDDYYDHDDYTDLEPLILLELRKIRALLEYQIGDDGYMEYELERTANAWRKQMKFLGRWDSRYEP